MAVVDDPRAGRDRLAQAMGLSPKTCAKHRDHALVQGALSILPVLGAIEGEGALGYHVAAFGSRAPEEVGAALEQAVLVNRTPDVQYWFCMAPDYSTALRRQERARASGMEVRETMNRDFLQNDRRLRRWLLREA